MVENKKFEEIHKRLTKRVELYVETIKEKYSKYMPIDKLEQLDNIEDYGQVLKIFDYGSINGYASDYDINMPLCAEKIFKLMKYVPGYGINKKHKTYTGEDIIINDNTFVDYLVHVFVTGTNTEGYYEDMLLHETMHFCGSGGATALKEGLNELLTRKVAFENDFRTSACGYPKEVKVAYELQKVFGEEIMDQIAFVNDENMILRYLDMKLGRDAAILYKNVSDKMEEEFDEKYYKHMDKYNGVSGIAKKVLNYKKLKYKEVYSLIDEYKEKHNIEKENINKKR